MFCDGIVDEYLSLLLVNRMFAEAQEQQNTFISYLIKENEIDHVIRRVYLTMLCLNLLANDKFKVKATMDEFTNKVPNAHMQDEFKIADKIKTAVLGDG